MIGMIWACSAPGQARAARAAADLKRDQHAITRLDAAHAITDLEHLRDALMAKRERRRKRRGPRDDHRVQVTGRHRDRADDRLAITGQPGNSRVAPLQIARPDVDQGAHRTHATDP